MTLGFRVVVDVFEVLMGPCALMQGNPIVICNTGDEETQHHASKFIDVPQQVDCLQGILTIIPLQLLSLHIAELRKCDVSICGNFLYYSSSVQIWNMYTM
jgi:glucosamine 6-phosphate synthetase-like amidotransferase/phosphosugar isomerase protein